MAFATGKDVFETFEDSKGPDQTARDAQSDQGICCQLTELLGTVDYNNEEQRSNGYSGCYRSLVYFTFDTEEPFTLSEAQMYMKSGSDLRFSSAHLLDITEGIFFVFTLSIRTP